MLSVLGGCTQHTTNYVCAHPDVITAPAMDASVAAPPGAAPASATQLPSLGPQLALEYTNWQDFTAAVHAHTTAQMKQVLSHLFPGTRGWRATLPCGTRPPCPGARAGPALETSAAPAQEPSCDRGPTACVPVV